MHKDLCYIRLVNESITRRVVDEEAYARRVKRLTVALIAAQHAFDYDRQAVILDTKRRLRTSFAVIKAQCVLSVAEYNLLALYHIDRYEKRAVTHGG